MYEGYPPTQEASILSIRLCLNIKHKSLASIMSTSIKKKKRGRGKLWAGLGKLRGGAGKAMGGAWTAMGGAGKAVGGAVKAVGGAWTAMGRAGKTVGWSWEGCGVGLGKEGLGNS